jgi:hypothetical protein
MRNNRFTITVPYLFSPKSAISAESKSYFVRFNVHETYQINHSNSLIFKKGSYSKHIRKYNILVIT